MDGNGAAWHRDLAPEMIVDVHPDPAAALVNGDQALEPAAFGDLMNELRSMAAALGLSL